MRVVRQGSRGLRAHFHIGVDGERRQGLPQRGILEPKCELRDPRQRGIGRPTQLLEQQFHHRRPGPAQHARVVGLDGRRQLGEALERDGDERRAVHALQRGHGGDVHGGVRVAKQPEQARRIRRPRQHREEPGALQPLPPATGIGVGPQQARPHGVAERVPELAPTLPGNPGCPGHERVHGHRRRQSGEPDGHRRQRPGPHGPLEHRLIQRLFPGTHLRAATHAEPAVENDQHHESREQRTLHHRDHIQDVAAVHRPTQRRIFSRATCRLLGFTR